MQFLTERNFLSQPSHHLSLLLSRCGNQLELLAVSMAVSMASTQGSNSEFFDTLDGQQGTTMQLHTAITSLTKEIRML